MTKPLTPEEIDATLKTVADLLDEYEDSRLNIIKFTLLRVKEQTWPKNPRLEESNSKPPNQHLKPQYPKMQFWE